MNRLINDAVVNIGLRALEVVKPCLMESEWRDAYEEFCAIARSEIEMMETLRQRQAQRVGHG